MIFSPPLVSGVLLKRYKRFLADVQLDDGSVVTAHCANTGSMLGLCAQGSKVYLSPNTNPKAKLDWRWEISSQGNTLVGINTSRPNKIVADAITTQEIPELLGYDVLKREVKYGANSRIDILLQGNEKSDCYVEVKNVTLCRDLEPTSRIAEFPDAVTTRGSKHLKELISMVNQGYRGVMFYLVQRKDCQQFKIADDIDPDYALNLKKALQAGVEVLIYECDIDINHIMIKDKLPFKI